MNLVLRFYLEVANRVVPAWHDKGEGSIRASPSTTLLGYRAGRIR